PRRGAVLVDPDAGAGADLLAVDLDDQLHVGDVDRGLLRDDAAGLRATGGLGDLRVLLDAVDALDEDALGLRVRGNDLAGAPAVLARDDEDGVALLHVHGPRAHRQDHCRVPGVRARPRR